MNNIDAGSWDGSCPVEEEGNRANPRKGTSVEYRQEWREEQEGGDKEHSRRTKKEERRKRMYLFVV